MTRALIASPLVLLTACGLFGGGDDMSGDTGLTCVVNENINGRPGVGSPSDTIGEEGLLIVATAQFRIDADGEIASLEVAGEDTVQGIILDLLPARDPIDLTLAGCRLIIPVTPDTTTVRNGQGSDIWRAEVRALLADIDSNCDDPAYASIATYSGGDVVSTFANNIQITLGEPLAGPSDFIAATEGDSIRDFLLGGTIQLRDDFAPIEMAVFVDAVDECGLWDPDDTDALLADGVLGDGPVNGVYRFINGPVFNSITFTTM